MVPTDTELVVVPANEASGQDLQSIFGERGQGARCRCQRYKLQPGESFASVPAEELAGRLREQTDCGHPTSGTTSGLVAYCGDDPVGWCAVERRSQYPGLIRNFRVPWSGRNEDPTDESVWAVTCFFVRVGFRRTGVSRALALAAAEYARRCGAHAVEGYPITSANAIAEELHVGTRRTFADAGFVEVGAPTPRRAVMRIDFG